MTDWPKAFLNVKEQRTCFHGIPQRKTCTRHESSYHSALAVAGPEFLSANYKKIDDL